MSVGSIVPYFPWCRMKLAYHNVNPEGRSALVRLEPDRRYRPLCHACRQAARTIHSDTRKFVQDLPFGECSMTLQVEYRKIWCDSCDGARVEHLEFVDAHQRVTHRLAHYAVQLCRAGLSVTAVARHLELDPKTVRALDKRALQAEFGKTSYAGLRRLAIDEIAVKKGHHYMTVVLDYDTGRVAWMGEGRGTVTLEAFFRKMPPTVRKAIQAVAMDMWDPYIQCVKRWCKNADIVFDLFHVVKAFNKVIDDIRNQEFRKADAAGKEVLKGSKYLFLKNWGNLRWDQRVHLEEILALNQRLNTVYWLKDLLAYIWDYHRPGWARTALAHWCEVAREDGHPKLISFARTLERHEYGIINHSKHWMHTSRLEGVNNKIKVIKRIAYGFHDLDYFALKVKQAFPGRLSSN